ncbi:MAG TPA: SgcJ/EcaC family oxidoreductase [Pirellulales bacterium]|nr:SgcJ/EcaC family oxidoreductase [Pirellulales bacterium]
MQHDEQQIRQLVGTWIAATKAGAIDTVLDLMTDDVVFLRPGHEPMIGKSSFAAAAKPQPGAPPPEIEDQSEIREIEVHGDVAFLWTRLSITIKPPGGAPIRRAGHTLTVLKKQNGKWLLARDANLLAPVAT